MEKKYAYKTLALSKDIGAALEARRVRLSVELGFQVSLSETIGWLLKKESEQLDAKTA